MQTTNSSRPIRQHARLPLRTFRVRVAPHLVAGRWEIPAREVSVPAADENHARVIVVREAHGLAGVAPWRAFVRESLQHAAVQSEEPR